MALRGEGGSRLVAAQIFDLPYRRGALGHAVDCAERQEFFGASQNEIVGRFDDAVDSD